MVLAPKQTFERTIKKLRTMWDIAIQLIGDYEDFDKRLTLLEDKIDSLSRQLNSTVNNINNV